jgi:glutathione synthase/RimK-type ligase-like ATP-grasp enzyme
MSDECLAILVPLRDAAAPPEHSALGRAALRLRARGVPVLFGDTAQDGILHGWRPVLGGWERARGRPRAVYDRFPSQGRAAAWASLQAGLGGAVAGNPSSIIGLCRDKLTFQEWCVAACPGVAMPAVEAAPAAFGARLAAWGAAFAKPRFGSRGVGVRRIVAGEAPPGPWSEGLVGPEPTLLQQAVPPPPGWAGACVRVDVQRDATGTLVVLPPALRRSVTDAVVNTARGAAVEAAAFVLPPRALLALESAARAVTAALVARPDGATVVEVGLDFACAADGTPWLLEANARPQSLLRGLSAVDPGRFAAAREAAAERPLRALWAWAGGDLA